MNQNNIFFTVVIPAWNRAALLPETISSIRRQTYTNWECIVVDDGSTDNTSEVIAAISKEDSRVRYLYQNNAERSAARNNGARNAKGRYLIFLDSDDYFMDEHLQVLHDFIESKNHPVGLFYTHALFLENDKIKKTNFQKMPEDNAFGFLLFHPLTPSRVCVHRDIMQEFEFDTHIVIVEDLILWLCVASKFPVYQIDSYSVVYRIHDGNSVDLSRNSYQHRLNGLKRFFSNARYKNIAKLVPVESQRHLLAECYFNIARHYKFVGKWMKMSLALLNSFMAKPNYRNKERLAMFLGIS